MNGSIIAWQKRKKNAKNASPSKETHGKQNPTKGERKKKREPSSIIVRGRREEGSRVGLFLAALRAEMYRGEGREPAYFAGARYGEEKGRRMTSALPRPSTRGGGKKR